MPVLADDRGTVGMLYAVTELGDYLVWNLGSFYQDYCELLGDVWRKVPLVWHSGLPVLAPPPTWHRCVDVIARGSARE
ncbi:MAG: hypothetical protein V2A73_09910 [Pseudomonadota bacterium]